MPPCSSCDALRLTIADLKEKFALFKARAEIKEVAELLVENEKLHQSWQYQRETSCRLESKCRAQHDSLERVRTASMRQRLHYLFTRKLP